MTRAPANQRLSLGSFLRPGRPSFAFAVGAILLAVACGGSKSLAPADSQSPAAPVCAEPPSSGPIIIELNPDVPAPRCAKARPDQSLRLLNRTAERIEGDFAGQRLSIPAGGAQDLSKRFGDYLAAGVHRISLPVYAGSGPELWVLPR